MRILPLSPSPISSLHPSESTAGNSSATWNGNLNTPYLYLAPPSNLPIPSLVLLIPSPGPTLTAQHLQHLGSQLYQHPEPTAPLPWNWTSTNPFAPNLVDLLLKRRNNGTEISTSATIAVLPVTTSRLAPFVPLDHSHPDLSKFMLLK